METNTQIANQSGWSIFFMTLMVLLVLFFIQKYIYLLDEKFSRADSSETNWQGKPWPLFAGLGIGLFLYIYNVFSPVDLTVDFNIQNPVKLFLFIISLAVFAGTVYESFLHFKAKTGTLRTLIYLGLIVLYFYAGLFAGFFLISVLALAILIYFFFYFKKLFT